MSNNNNLNQNKHISPSHSTVSTLTNRSTSSTRSNSTTQACAACRYQRRKCAPDCVLAPYFPHDRQRQFQNAHKLFGVRNITKIVQDLDQQRKEEAMRTIIYQSDVRAQDPVGGCYRIIRDLQRQIECSQTELEIILHQLAFYRAHGAQNQNQNQQILIDGCDLYDLETGNNNNHNDLNHHGLDTTHNHDHEQYIMTNQDDGCEDENVINSWANMNNSPQSSNPCLEVKSAAVADECEEFKQLLINEVSTGERHEFKFEFDEINEPSDETLFNDGNHKDSTKEDENVTFFTKEENVTYQQHNEDHDLKGAATLFTLTNCSSY